MCTDSLAHYGIKGMKWGVHRYKNEDGTLSSFTLSGVSSSDNKFVKKYREEHPNTKVSKNEILKIRDTTD